MIYFIVLIFTIYTLTNYHVYKRGFQALEILPLLVKRIYRLIFIILAVSYIAARVISRYIPLFVYDLLVKIGAFWFAFLIYFFMAILLIEIIRLPLKKLKSIPETETIEYKNLKLKIFCIVVILVSLIIGYGSYNAQDIRVKTITLTLPKKQANIDSLNIVFFSDSHFSVINDEHFCSKVINKVNSLNPDLILLGGDVVDNHPEHLYYHKINTYLKKLNPKFGSYTCNGNHEFINGVDVEDDFMNKCGVKVLRDTFVTAANSLQIIGREDKSINRYNLNRKSVKELVNMTNKNLPVILLDHQPFHLEEAAENNIDLQLSGHTHSGQFFPGNIITSFIYELNWGYKKKNNTQYYVSSGVGAWGPPVKIFSDAEIVNIRITFK
jgi:uncharacterized protein